MVKDPNQVPKKQVLPEQGNNGQGHHITGHSDQRFCCVRESMRGMFRKIAAAKQSPFQQITPLAARRRNQLVDDSLITPNKLMSFLDHPPEEV
jgi:hypothetical protein